MCCLKILEWIRQRPIRIFLVQAIANDGFPFEIRKKRLIRIGLFLKVNLWINLRLHVCMQTRVIIVMRMM